MRTRVGCRIEKRLLGDYSRDGPRAFIRLIRYLLVSLSRR
jgi:hypothetical protein